MVYYSDLLGQPATTVEGVTLVCIMCDIIIVWTIWGHFDARMMKKGPAQLQSGGMITSPSDDIERDKQISPNKARTFTVYCMVHTPIPCTHTYTGEAHTND